MLAGALEKPASTWTTGQMNTNLNLILQSLLSPYLAKNINVYKCPPDPYLSPLKETRVGPREPEAAGAYAEQYWAMLAQLSELQKRRTDATDATAPR